MASRNDQASSFLPRVLLYLLEKGKTHPGDELVRLYLNLSHLKPPPIPQTPQRNVSSLLWIPFDILPLRLNLIFTWFCALWLENSSNQAGRHVAGKIVCKVWFCIISRFSFSFGWNYLCSPAHDYHLYVDLNGLRPWLGMKDELRENIMPLTFLMCNYLKI